MEPECNFWGVKISSGKSVTVAPEYKEDFITSVHLTQVALGDKAAAGGHTVFIEKDGQKYALGTLDKDKCPHFSLDIHLATDSIELSHTGKSAVYLTGYEAVSIAGDDEDTFPMGAMQDSDDQGESGSDESEDENEDAPPGVPINKQNGRLVMIDDEAEEGESEEEEDEEDGDSDEDDSDDDGLRSSGEDSDSEEDDEEEESEEEGGSSEEDAVPQAKGKRGAVKPPAATPQPKRSKEAAGGAAKAPATAPPKVASAPPSTASDYLSTLKAHLSQQGPTKLAVLGSAVKRPPKVPKLKHFLEQHKAVFKYDAGNDTVSLLP